jgi:hypothetical protein
MHVKEKVLAFNMRRQEYFAFMRMMLVNLKRMKISTKSCTTVDRIF